MGSSQKYSLKWNDFTSNVAYTFRDLHSRHDFVDVTLACSDGSTLEAHKVILSSVSTYFKEILKTTPCKHPIIILKDTGREEAQAMLEFAYTGEVNVGQDLLPTLLHTARSYRIKGLDKVETPLDPLHGKSQTPSSEHWGESAPPTRSHTPSSVHSQHEIGRPMANVEQRSSPPNFTSNGFLLNRERDMQPNSTSPTSLTSSQPPTREASPAPLSQAAALNNSRTPPPKRWKRSFDMTHPINKDHHHQPLPLIAEKYFPHNRMNEYDSHGPKRFCEPSQTANGDVTNNNTNGNAENGRGTSRSAPYPHSMPTSPTMFERGNETRLAGLFRHHLANDLSRGVANGISDGKTTQQPASSTTSPSDNALDYRCFSNGQTKVEPHDEYSRQNGVDRRSPEETERFRRGSIAGFRPESAPTVLDMSPEGSLSGPPSVRDVDGHREDEIHSHFHNGDDTNAEYVSKGFALTPDAMGRYTCDECGKIFKHPGSLQHHRHIHRGTHRCPSCGKVFSRRWDMERHLNKSKYGCPANRFSTGSSGSSSTGSSERGGVSVSAAPLANITPSVASAVTTAAAHLEMLAHASSVASNSNAAAAAAAAAAVAVAANSAAATTNHTGTA